MTAVTLRRRDAGLAAGAACAGGALLASVPELAALAACPLRALTGVPCPLCGGTTSVLELVHLDPAGSLAASPLGLALAAGAVLALLSRRATLRVPVAALLTVTAALWAFQLHRLDIV